MRVTPQTHTRRLRVRSAASGYALVAPKFMFFVGLLVVPIGYTLYLSQRRGSILGPGENAGFRNFEVLFSDPIFWLSLRNTALYVLLVIPATIFVALVLAAILNTKPRGAGFFTLALILPTVTPTVAAAIVWNNLLQGDGGVVNTVLRALGGESVLWLGNPDTVIPVIALVEFWRGLGFYVVVFIAGLQSIPAQIYEAAALDGVVGARAFWTISVPLLRPIVLFGTVMATIFSFQVFDTPFVMTQGGPGYSSTTLVLYIYRNAFALDNMGVAAAMAFVLMLIVLVLSIAQLRVFRSDIQY